MLAINVTFDDIMMFVTLQYRGAVDYFTLTSTTVESPVLLLIHTY